MKSDRPTRILFICHGNICRSTMAESMFTDMALKSGELSRFEISSAATHPDELGHSPHYGTRQKLASCGIPLVPHRARLLTRADGEYYDYIIGMDEENLYFMRRILAPADHGKIALLLDYTSAPRAVADPWYTGDFDATYEDLKTGIQAFWKFLHETRRGE